MLLKVTFVILKTHIGNKKYTMKPFFNAHTHVFSYKHVPKYLAKKVFPWPFYYLFSMSPLMTLFNWIKKRKAKKYRYSERNEAWKNYKVLMFLKRSTIFNVIQNLISTVARISYSILILFIITKAIRFEFRWLNNLLQYFKIDTISSAIIILFLILAAFPSIQRKFLHSIWFFIKKLLGEEQMEFAMRYFNIVEFSKKERTGNVFKELKNQYPPGSKFIVLPMDMEFMEAGPLKESYEKQMEGLQKLKKAQNQKNTICFPFAFAHPERIGSVYKISKIDQGKNVFTLNTDCPIIGYLESDFCGVKIYPALGYFPFDKALLPLWKYCADQGIPITTHCSVGPIYYRGTKKKIWDKHPIFQSNMKNKDGRYKKIRLTGVKNKNFQRDFTHPMNYLCLIDTNLFKILLETYNDESLYNLFEYDNTTRTFKGKSKGLSDLKINLAHYGGAESWDQFLEQDRYDNANKLIMNKSGLDIKGKLDARDVASIEKYWKDTDWFSIITTMILQYKNVYADVSYTSHDIKYMSLLSHIMKFKDVSNRILYGTDFYVVSNHKTEKQYYMDMQHHLSEEQWEKISISNPTKFLYSKNIDKESLKFN